MCCFIPVLSTTKKKTVPSQKRFFELLTMYLAYAKLRSPCDLNSTDVETCIDIELNLPFTILSHKKLIAFFLLIHKKDFWNFPHILNFERQNVGPTGHVLIHFKTGIYMHVSQWWFMQFTIALLLLVHKFKILIYLFRILVQICCYLFGKFCFTY